MTRADAVAFIERWQRITVSRLCGFRDCGQKCKRGMVVCAKHHTAGGKLTAWKRSNYPRYREALRALGDADPPA